jgi:hypothetical protein
MSDQENFLNWLARFEQVPDNVMALEPPKTGQPTDDEVTRLKRRGNTVASQIMCQVHRTEDEVHFIIGNGRNKVTYHLGAELAKSIGEELFKEGANLAQAQENKRRAG